MFKIKLEMLGKEYAGKGETIQEAIEDIGLTGFDIKAKGLITVKKGRKKAERLLYLPQLRRMMTTKLGRQLLAKQMGDYINLP